MRACYFSIGRSRSCFTPPLYDEVVDINGGRISEYPPLVAIISLYILFIGTEWMDGLIDKGIRAKSPISLIHISGFLSCHTHGASDRRLDKQDVRTYAEDL